MIGIKYHTKDGDTCTLQSEDLNPDVEIKVVVEGVELLCLTGVDITTMEIFNLKHIRR